MNGNDRLELEPKAVRRAFERASAGYDARAVLATTVRTELIARLDLLAFEPKVILDLGTGTGHGAAALRQRFRAARVLALDASAGMLREAGARQGWRRRFDRLRADGARLPLKDASIDLIYSNLMLPWAIDLDVQLRELRRVLTPNGYVTFTTLGPDTLRELRVAWSEVDTAAHVHGFLDMHDIGDALVRAGFADPVMDVDRYTLTYESLQALGRDLKGLGAANALSGRIGGLTGPRRFARVEAAYQRFRMPDGRLPASCEVVFGQAWCPGGAPPVRSRRGEVVVPFGSIGRR